MGRTTYWVWSIKRRMMGFWVLVRLWIRLYDPQFLPVPTQDHSGPLVCRMGQAGDKLLNAAAAPCNFSGYRESAGAWLTLNYPSPSLRVSSQRQSVRVRSLLIALEGLFSVAWYLQPGIVPAGIVHVYSCEKQKDLQYRACSAQVCFWCEHLCPLQKCCLRMSCFQSNS